MKTITRSLLALFALVTTTALAVEPVAVWSGFNTLQSGNFTANIGALVPDATTGAVTLGSRGITFANSGDAWSGSAKGFTVAVKYSTFKSGTAAALVSLQQNSETSTAGINKLGAWVNASGKVQGLWEGNAWGTAYGTLPASGVIFVRYNDSNGTQIHMQDKTLMFGAGNLKSSNNNWGKSFAVGSFANGTSNVASGMTIEAVAIFDSRLSDNDMAGYEFPEPEEPKAGPQLVWEGNSATANKTLSQAVEKGKPFTLIVNMTNTDSATTAGSYIIDKISAGQMITPFCIATDSFTGFNTSANVPNSSVSYYEKKSGGFWVGVGSRSSSGNATWNEEKKGDDVSAYDSIYVAYSGTVGADGQVASYVRMIYAHNKNTDQYYTLSNTTASLTIGDALDTMNVNSSVSTLAFKVYLDNTQRNVDGIKQAIEAIINPPASIVSATISGNETWGNLEWNPSVPTASDKTELTVSANAKLTIDNNTAFKSLKLIGQRNLTIAGITSANIALLSKISAGSFTGKLTFEIDASSGLTADDALKNFIKAADTKCTFIFKGAGNKGATINYGTSVNETLNTHIVFDGGTHAFTYGQGVESKDFGAHASNENPTVWVKNSATLNFTAKDLTGWNGTANANGVIRVDNGAKLNFLASGRNTIYYRQRLCLEPGASVTFPDVTGQHDSKPVVRFLGGTAEGNEVIYVLPSTGNVTAATISGNIFLASDNTHGFGVFVDSNSCLKWTGNALVFDNNDDKAIVKRGAGVFEYSGTMDGVVQVLDGSIGGDGSLRKLTFSGSGALNLDNGALTVTGSLTTSTSKQLKLTIASPTHMMPVITLPAAADKTGWTALVNGRAEVNELLAEGNTLKLKWKEPPTIDEIDPETDVEVKSSADYTASKVVVKVNYSKRGDYTENDMTYQIVIGEKTYAGVASGEGDAKTVAFDIGELEGGKIYRGEFQVLYGENNEAAATAPIVIRQGKLVYIKKDPWVNETPSTLKTTGSYDPESGVEVVGDIIQINTTKNVTFTPTADPDYVDKCDSSFTVSIMADEALDDDESTIDEGAQAGVKIVSDGKGGVKFQFIAGEEWVDGPAAELNKLYDVFVSFHYVKDNGIVGDEDTVTYVVGEWTGSYSRRANTANKVTEIIFTDGCQFAKLIGTCELESAAQGIKPGEETEIDAENDKDAQEKAASIPVLIPDDELVVAALDTDAKKADYKALFKVVAVKKNGSYTAEVVFKDEVIPTIKDDEEKILTEVVSALSSLLGEEGELQNIKGQPGLYYGIAADGELVKMGDAKPDEWVIANKDGNIVGLKVKKTASAKKGFYKVICTPVKSK